MNSVESDGILLGDARLHRQQSRALPTDGTFLSSENAPICAPSSIDALRQQFVPCSSTMDRRLCRFLRLLEL